MALQFNVDGKLHQEYIDHLDKPLIEVLHPQGSPLKTRAQYICKWASRVLYERQVNHYGLMPASAEML
ncbi:hypothetical protein [Limnobacter litoralis]|uniref:Uncharacterized protein n=1 Tax=Limnobacter litoralis TaxID=481366 RepID=A0ABQ5YSM6_9BURK|nr:hypothetical protein [Limnobacter litoralis]GLR27503.1 hypothetical protein GCM10007875_25940 [Limnobacter litoralis]